MLKEKTLASGLMSERSDDRMREVICCDAFEKLRMIEPVTAIITSLPDASEVECGLDGYVEWFTLGVGTILNCVSPGGVAIFYQGDRKHKGLLLSKATLLCNAACALNFQLLWHKIVLRNPPGTVNLYRPSYLHMMAFSRSLKAGRPTADVIDRGPTIYKNGMSINAAVVAVRFAARQAKTDIIHDPFCGRGTVLAVANALGIKSVGFDISEQQCAYARDLQVSLSVAE
jgi:hypothetical protein